MQNTPAVDEEKYNDPRAKITRRGVWMGVGVAVFAIVGASLSIYLRRTQLEKTREFFGPETITALQLGERIQLLPRGTSDFAPVELTATPGLGYLRHALLDQRHYQWDSIAAEPVAALCGSEKSFCVELLLTDPTAHRFSEVRIDLELNDGWVGLASGPQRVQVTERVRPALKHFLETVMHVQRQRVDLR